MQKFVDCRSKDLSQRELYIVEGDSALGSVKMARNAEFQAVIPVRGKILNCLKADYDKIFKNEIITDLIKVIGCGVEVKTGKNKEISMFNLDNLRWNKIVICTDADVDGAHIDTLMLTFFYRFMPELIKDGHVYLAMPPLYQVTRNKKNYYAYSDDELNQILTEIGRDNQNKIQRYKGLGEMDASQLWETTMDPNTRILKQVKIDEDKLSEMDQTFTILMGDDVEPRREFIEANAKFVKNLDI